MIALAVGCGLAGAVGAVIFRFLIQLFREAFFSSGEFFAQLAAGSLVLGDEDLLAPGLDLPAWRRLLAPALGGLLVGPLVYYLAREAMGHGVPEVMEAVARRGGVIRARVAGVKAVASALCIASGGSVGREGPIVQIGSALGSTIGQWFRLPSQQLRTLVGCGAAAGIAATFNAPIAGALFAAEVILANFAAARLGPIVISSVVATVVSRLFLGDTPAFSVPSYELVSPLELLPYSALGVLAGLIGVGFATALYTAETHFQRLAVPPPLRAAVGGLAVGAIGMLFPQVFGVGYGAITAALRAELPISLLAVLLFAKIAATSLTLGSGGSGGVFAPSLFLGAMAGGLVGSLLQLWFPAATASSGAYALVTMGAVVAATTHAPITAIIMIFEMTRSLAIIPPLMAACVISTLVASYLRRDSIYTMKLARRGVDLLAERDPNVLKSLVVRDVMEREPELLPSSAPFAEILDLMVRSRHSEFFVVDPEGHHLGAISVAALRRHLFERDALRHIVVAVDLLEARPTVRESDNLDTVMQLLTSAQCSELAVVSDRDARRIIGAVREADLREAYNTEVLRRDLTGGISSRVELAERGRVTILDGDFALAEIEVPRRFAGKTLRELDLRARDGIQVLLLRDAGETGRALRVPRGDEVLAPGERMLIAGHRDIVEQLAAGFRPRGERPRSS